MLGIFRGKNTQAFCAAAIVNNGTAWFQ